jgi:hypothetical protein
VNAAWETHRKASYINQKNSVVSIAVTQLLHHYKTTTLVRFPCPPSKKAMHQQARAAFLRKKKIDSTKVSKDSSRRSNLLGIPPETEYIVTRSESTRYTQHVHNRYVPRAFPPTEPKVGQVPGRPVLGVLHVDLAKARGFELVLTAGCSDTTTGALLTVVLPAAAPQISE